MVVSIVMLGESASIAHLGSVGFIVLGIIGLKLAA